MLRRIEFHDYRGPWRFVYSVCCNSLYKPRRLPKDGLDIREDHFGFLDGSRQPRSYQERKIHALLIHENTHSERMLKHGLLSCWWWIQRYHFSRSFRWAEERVAYHAEFEKLVEYGIPIPFEHIARVLSGPIYFSMISFDDALEWVRSTVTSLGDLEYAVRCLECDQWIRARRHLFGGDDECETIAATAPKPAPRDPYWLADRIALVVCGVLSSVGIFFVTIAATYFGGG